MGEFQAEMAIRKVDRLAREGFREIKKYVSERLGAHFKLDTQTEQGAIKAIALRNIIVHNYGRANAHFLEKTGYQDIEVGDLVPLDLPTAKKASDTIRGVATSIDGALLKKYGDALGCVQQSA